MSEPSKAAVAEEVSWESKLRQPMGILALVAGTLTLISSFAPVLALRGAPTVGVVQGLTPALNGQANPAVSPRAPEVRFLSHHALALIGGSLAYAIGLTVLAFALRFLYDAVGFRRPGLLPAARYLVFYVAIIVGVLSLATQVVEAIVTHNFVHGHDFTNHAVDYAIDKSPARLATAYLTLVGELGLVVGLITVVLNAMRVGLLTRTMGGIGLVASALLIIPFGVLSQVVPALWFGALGVLLLGRWPVDPPAWKAGTAIAWPSSAELREQRDRARAERGLPVRGRPPRQSPQREQPAAAPIALAEADPAPAPVPAQASARRRRRKRKGGARR